MATMIPSIISPDTPSAGERAVFERLSGDPGTKDWIVLHSLNLARTERRISGEIDFVVIMPGHGVLCLEVKGCSAANLRRDERGLWYYGPHDTGEPRSPFRQASDGMYALRRELLQARPEFEGIQMSSGVVFPFAPFRQRSVEWNDWEVIDSQTFRTPLSRSLPALMGEARKHLLAAPIHPNLDPSGPTSEKCAMICDTLRGAFEVPVDHRARSEALHLEVMRYTSEQFVALSAMDANPRVIFTGPAGVGKTVLAIEAARRARAAGRRVLFLCYNYRLGAWLEKETADLQPEVITRTLHAHMRAVAGEHGRIGAVNQRYWETTLPEKAIDRLLATCAEEDGRFLYDELIVDEAQDILRDLYLDFLDLSLHGGLAGGRWRIFGDFENQAIYGAATLDLDDFRATRAGPAPLFMLRVNCRNTPLVAEWVRLLAGLAPGYDRILRPDDGVQPELRFYTSDAAQQRMLVESLAELALQGYRGSDIVVLSPKGDAACVAGKIEEEPWRSRLRPLFGAPSGQIPYGTIQGFKGLEAPAVIVTDIETIGTPHDRALLYIATTRPLQRLTILAHERVRSEAVKQIAG